MKYQVEITYREIYSVEADSAEEARELVVSDCGFLEAENEVENIEVRRAL